MIIPTTELTENQTNQVWFYCQPHLMEIQFTYLLTKKFSQLCIQILTFNKCSTATLSFVKIIRDYIFPNTEFYTPGIHLGSGVFTRPKPVRILRTCPLYFAYFTFLLDCVITFVLVFLIKFSAVTMNLLYQKLAKCKSISRTQDVPTV